MAAITVVAAQVSPVKIYQEQTFIAAATISPGQVLYELAGGSAGLAKADAGSTSVPLWHCHWWHRLSRSAG
jgi:hypothetical protein